MADIKAFRALRYDTARAGEIQTLITQPYDVINAAQQEAYYEANPYNIIRLEYGKKYAADTPQENRYSRAAADFAAWQQEGILLQDEKPAFYRYVQEFEVEGQSYRRSGFLATVKAAGYADGMVLPHEETLPGHKEDRYRLMQACLANFSPIFGLYAEAERGIDRTLAAQTEGQTPLLDTVDEAGVRQLLWRVDEADAVAQIEEKLADYKIYIADGHHRYETASRFAADQREKGVAGCDYMLIDLVNLYDPGLVVLPTHRLVKNLEDFSSHGLLEALTDSGFAVVPCESLAKLQAIMAEKLEPDTAAFGLYVDGDFYLLAMDREDPIIPASQPGRSEAYQQLDVSIAHSLILEGLCGIDAAALAAESNLAYCREAEEAIAKVDQEGFQFALLLNSTRVQELLDVADAGEKMPQKSTYFYPKIIAGLVINKLGE